MSNINNIFKELNEERNINKVEKVNEESEKAAAIRQETEKDKTEWSKEQYNAVKEAVNKAGADYVGLSSKGYILVKKSKSGSKASVKLYKLNRNNQVIFHVSGEMDLKIKNDPKATEENELENDYKLINAAIRATVKFLDKMEAKHKDVWDKRREDYYAKRGQKPAAEKADEEQEGNRLFGYLNENGDIIDMRDSESPSIVEDINELDTLLGNWDLDEEGNIIY